MTIDISWLDFSFLDWIACAIFLLCWVGYTRYAIYKSNSRPTLMSALEHHRKLWMLNAVLIPRIETPRDILAIGMFERSVTFFASTTILILAGLLTLLGSSEKIANVMASLHFVNNAVLAQIQIKILLIILLFVHAFFKFCWSMRCYNFLATMLGSMPLKFANITGQEIENNDEIKVWSTKSAGILNSAAHHFNLGLRAYYFALAVLAWFVHPIFFILANLLVVAVLYRRDFKSQVLDSLYSSMQEIDMPNAERNEQTSNEGE